MATILIAFFGLWLALAPMPHGIALNHQTKECGGFWAGDEYGGSTLPEGWHAYYPGNDGMIQTEIGSCYFGSYQSTKGAESCCRELGCTFVGESVGDARISPLMAFGLAVYAGACCLVVCLIGLVVGLAVALVMGVGVFFIRRSSRKRD